MLIAAPAVSAHVTWRPALWIVLALAALSHVLPFALEFLALRRLTTSAFGTLVSLEPAIATLIGLLVLGQTADLAPAAGVAFVVIAGMGVTRTGAPPGARTETLRPTSVVVISGNARAEKARRSFVEPVSPRCLVVGGGLIRVTQGSQTHGGAAGGDVEQVAAQEVLVLARDSRATSSSLISWPSARSWATAASM